jgi:hypothetical protein
MDLGVGQLDSNHQINPEIMLKEKIPVTVAVGVVAEHVICQGYYQESGSTGYRRQGLINVNPLQGLYRRD